MLQNPCKTLGFKKNMVYKIPPGGGGKPYPASGLKYNICFSLQWQTVLLFLKSITLTMTKEYILQACDIACVQPVNMTENATIIDHRPALDTYMGESFQDYP